jgi:hypothetical protein
MTDILIHKWMDSVIISQVFFLSCERSVLTTVPTGLEGTNAVEFGGDIRAVERGRPAAMAAASVC